MFKLNRWHLLKGLAAIICIVGVVSLALIYFFPAPPSTITMVGCSEFRGYADDQTKGPGGNRAAAGFNAGDMLAVTIYQPPGQTRQTVGLLQYTSPDEGPKREVVEETSDSFTYTVPENTNDIIYLNFGRALWGMTVMWGCTPAPNGRSDGSSGNIGNSSARTYEVLRADRLVLTVRNKPGAITSTATPPANSNPVMHPFLSATAHAANEENALHAILEQSSDFDDFLRRLTRNGYTTRERLNN